MFENDITITGKHATQLKYLNEGVEIFPRYIDVYMAAAIFGAINSKLAKKDTESNDRARIYADTVIRESNRLNRIFKTIILSDETKGWVEEEKMNICFRYRDKNAEEDNLEVPKEEIQLMQEAKELFDSYVLGGIEELYDFFTNAKVHLTSDEVINKAYEFAKNQKIVIETKGDQYDDSSLLRQEF